jgi:hypothetical protein
VEEVHLVRLRSQVHALSLAGDAAAVLTGALAVGLRAALDNSFQNRGRT